MRSIARRTAVGAALLLVMPVAVWISGWRWQPGEQSWLLKAAFWVTETVTQPWGVITHLILFGWFLWCLRFRIKAAIMLFAILAAAILVGQGVKSWIKDKVQEPRPFVIWLEKTHHIPVDEFYTLKRAERGNLVKEQLAEEKISHNICVHTGRKRRGLPFLPVTRCLLPVGHCWPLVCCGRVGER